VIAGVVDTGDKVTCDKVIAGDKDTAEQLFVAVDNNTGD
jgi:hypothetical protein